eukprot:TRINITY_DN6562_c0_g1_i1.p1 TRINITY_DN6562_c0_g1~~TRINITY_DN6562_c0_g1_i1.p1  ORF type:complete len:156 (+),score=27.29 TRINITY_DN6562_c0_g1_i1:56-469(+)
MDPKKHEGNVNIESLKEKVDRIGDLHCPICFDTLKKPVSILCGHSFCKDCLKGLSNLFDRCVVCDKTFPKNVEDIGINLALSKALELLNENKKAVKSSNEIKFEEMIFGERIAVGGFAEVFKGYWNCLLYTSPSPRD